MVKIKNIYFLILLAIINIASAIDLMLTGFIYDVSNDELSILKEGFNQYSQEHHLGINLDTYYYTYRNSTSEMSNVSYILKEFVSQKEKNKYDLFLIDSIYSGVYADHFENLYYYLPKETTDLYDKGVTTATSVKNGRLVSLPLYVDYGGLYYNDILLNKYNKTIPTTWDELIDTFNYINERESAIGNTLNKYVGFPYGEASVAHTLEFIHSFRDNDKENFPSYESQNAIEALLKMKEVKEKISDKDTLTKSQFELFRSIHRDHKQYIFFRYWYSKHIYMPKVGNLDEVSYKFAPLPGKKSGISGSCIGGSNIALNRYISEEKKKAAVEVYKYLFSYEFQKRLIIDLDRRSAIHSLYSDAEVCNVINCTMYSNIQGIVRPSSSSPNYEEFSSKFSSYIKDYIIDGKRTAEETLTLIDNIQRIHFVEVTSISGIIILISIVIAILLILVSYIYISIKRSRIQFNFLPFNYWCYFLLGLSILICSSLTGMGNFNEYSCVLRPVLISIGFSLSYMPFFIKMASIYPHKNMIVKFINNNNNLVLVLSVLTDMIINFVWILYDPVKVQKEAIPDGESYKICKPSHKLGLIMIIILLFKAVTIIFSMGFLVVSEWNIKIFKSDIRHIGNAVYLSIINIVIYLVIIFIHFTSRYLHNGIRCGITIVFCFSNLILILGPKIYKISFYKEKVNDRKNINRFIEETSAFSDNYQQKFNFINIEDIVDPNYLSQINEYGSANINNYPSGNRKMDYNYGNMGTYDRRNNENYNNSTHSSGDALLFSNTISSTEYDVQPINNNIYNNTYSNKIKYPHNFKDNYNIW
ncbi:hypothetical protein PIROE2DRAFT_2782 [Piromyces sp. E2]|nr:hypothetical protein PIROE2DRAFT_2782 [Piromyces sp. E2]|eukprot:OUM69285.1 hypothetical protein PIROE2DRAFT_2782 [Piromyces sp. E2]